MSIVKLNAEREILIKIGLNEHCWIKPWERNFDKNRIKRAPSNQTLERNVDKNWIKRAPSNQTLREKLAKSMLGTIMHDMH